MTIKLIVGLANPGKKYSTTRHNAGAWYVSQLANYFYKPLKEESNFFGYTSQYRLGEYESHLLIPTTFMNLSGKAVAAMATFYRIMPEEIMVAHDELNLIPGNVRLKFGGGHGGHNGLKDVISYLGKNTNFYRMRIGIGHPGNKQKVADFVLGRPLTSEQELINRAIDEAVYCTNTLVEQDIIKAINHLNSYKPI